MQTYLVGGAVRDRLLGLPVTERDYLVVGATPEQLLQQGFRQVGRDFPIFIHPQDGSEYALARTASGSRQTPAAPLAHPGVTLEEDLSRRDLTINAMAESDDGELIDPFGGRRDLEQRVLRHISPAFAEDPIRVLRVARFMARFASLGFHIAGETRELMRSMVDAGQLNELVPERVWQELDKALGEPNPVPFFATLREVGALARLLPELDSLWGVPQPERWHPEIDTGVHTMMVLAQAARLSDEQSIRFAALTHDLGKASTPAQILPSHHGHEERGVAILRALCRRLRVPTRYQELAECCGRYHSQLHHLDELKATARLKLLERLDAFRRPQRLEAFLLVCEADFRGRAGFEQRTYPQADRLRRLYRAAASVDSSQLPKWVSGKAMGDAMRRLRLEVMRRVDREVS